MTITVVGQGLAGSLLAWELARAGLDFRLFDPGHATAASRVGAGMINPITGQRWAPTWRFDPWRAPARATYQTLAAELDLPLWRDLRVFRPWRDDADRATYERRRAATPDAPHWGPATTTGAWLHHAAQVDTAALIAALRARWLATGQLLPTAAPPDLAPPVIWCIGTATTDLVWTAPAPWQSAHGELLTGALTPVDPALDPNVILSGDHWLLPAATGPRVTLGATFSRDPGPPRPTAAARAELLATAHALTGRDLAVETHEAATRLVLPDKRPLAGWWPDRPGHGVFTALAAKGTLWAPTLAHQWALHLAHGTPFDAEVSPDRLSPTAPPPAVPPPVPPRPR